MGQLILTQNSSVDTPAAGAVILANKNGSIIKKDYLGNEYTLENTRNRIINGGMRINQRVPSASGSATTDQAYTLDRFFIEKSYAGTLTWTHDSDVPSAAEFTTAKRSYQSFKNSLKLITTQDNVNDAGDYLSVAHKIEGYNIADIIGDGYNTGFTLSFWVKNTQTGTYCVSFRNTSANRSYIATYTVNAASTWEFKTITVTAAPSGGTWDSTNSWGLFIDWTLHVGTTYGSGTNDTWTSTNSIASASQTNWSSSASNQNFWITGVQLEAGLSASQFEFRPFQQELALCQRYYEKNIAVGTAPLTALQSTLNFGGNNAAAGSYLYCTFPFKVPKRATGGTCQIWDESGNAGQLKLYTVNIGASIQHAGTATATETGIIIYDAAANGYGIFSVNWTVSSEL